MKKTFVLVLIHFILVGTTIAQNKLWSTHRDGYIREVYDTEQCNINDSVALPNEKFFCLNKFTIKERYLGIPARAEKSIFLNDSVQFFATHMGLARYEKGNWQIFNHLNTSHSFKLEIYFVS
jgi:hypothetical protein